MQLLIDADGCPVVDISILIAQEYGVPVALVCDSSHQMDREGATTHYVSKGADSADFYLVNLAKKGDVVVTQDYGLAAMCLARGCRALNQNGMEFGENNIDLLLFQRHEAKKIRRAGGRLRGPAPRTQNQDAAFATALRTILAETTGSNAD